MSISDEDERERQARVFHRAVFERMDDIGRLHLPVTVPTEPGRLVAWAAADDEDGFARAAAEAPAGGVFTTVAPRETRPSSPHSHGGADHAACPQAIFVDLDVATADSGKPSAADATPESPGYADTHEEALRLLEAFDAAYAVAPHCLVRTPGGWQVWYLAEPMVAEADREILARFEEALLESLRGYAATVDRGVITRPAGTARVPGSLHQKHRGDGRFTEPVLVTVERVSDHPVYELDALRSRLPVLSRPLPVAESDDDAPWRRLSAEVPVSGLLGPVLGLEPVRDTGSESAWHAPRAGAQSKENVRVYVDDRGVEHAVVYSASTAAWLSAEFDGIGRGDRFDTFDLLTAVWAGGDHRSAARLCDAHSADLTALVARLLDPETDAAALRQAADAAGWPDDVDSFGASYLRFRGVSPDLARSRGTASPGTGAFPSDESVPTPSRHDFVRWLPGSATPLSSTVHDEAGETHWQVRVPAWVRQTEESVEEKVTVSWVASAGLRRDLVDIHPQARESATDPGTPLMVVSGGASAGPHPTTHTDAVLAAAHSEAVPLAVVGIPGFAAAVVQAGSPSNDSRRNRLAYGWRRIPLDGRDVVLAGRVDWRTEPGIAELSALLAQRGARVRVVDPPDRQVHRTSRLAPVDGSVMGIGDLVTEDAAKGVPAPLTALLGRSLDADEAVFEARPVGEEHAQLVDRAADVLAHRRSHIYDADARAWARDTGTRWKLGGSGVSPAESLTGSLRASGVAERRLSAVPRVVETVANRAAVQAGTADFDVDPWTLYTANGWAVDLRTGARRRRLPGEMNLRTSGAVLDPEATAPRWERFLDEITGGDRDLVRVLQRIAGLGSIGAMLEEIVVICYGTGANGKTVFLDTLRKALGSYAAVLPAELMTAQAKEHQIAQLFGIRWGVMSETADGDRINTRQIKNLCESAELTAAHKYGHPFTFIPQHLMLLATNYKPHVGGQDEGIWRRLLVVPFLQHFPAESRELDLSERLAAELPGILNWVIAGAVEVAQRYHDPPTGGLLGTCAAIDRATQGYRRDNDLLGRFIEEHCVVGEDYRVPRSRFREALVGFFEDEEGLRHPWSTQRITNELDSRTGLDVRLRKNHGLIHYVGIGLRSDLSETQRRAYDLARGDVDGVADPDGDGPAVEPTPLRPRDETSDASPEAGVDPDTAAGGPAPPTGTDDGGDEVEL